MTTEKKLLTDEQKEARREQLKDTLKDLAEKGPNGRIVYRCEPGSDIKVEIVGNGPTIMFGLLHIMTEFAKASKSSVPELLVELGRIYPMFQAVMILNNMHPKTEKENVPNEPK